MTSDIPRRVTMVQSVIRYGLYVGGYGVMGGIIGIYAGTMGALAGLVIGYSLRRSLEAMLAFGAAGWLGTVFLCIVVASMVGIIRGVLDHIGKRSIKQD